MVPTTENVTRHLRVMSSRFGRQLPRRGWGEGNSAADLPPAPQGWGADPRRRRTGPAPSAPGRVASGCWSNCATSRALAGCRVRGWGRAGRRCSPAGATPPPQGGCAVSQWPMSGVPRSVLAQAPPRLAHGIVAPPLIVERRAQADATGARPPVWDGASTGADPR